LKTLREELAPATGLPSMYLSSCPDSPDHQQPPMCGRCPYSINRCTHWRRLPTAVQGILPGEGLGPRGRSRAWNILAAGRRRGPLLPESLSRDRRPVRPHRGKQPSRSQSTASLRDVKKRVGQGGTCTPRKKFAKTRSTGDLPNRAMREAPQGMDQTPLASRLTEPTAAISTSMG
jgi:hypothetical protein